jgi:rhodanese-related sulfurtransferase
MNKEQRMLMRTLFLSAALLVSLSVQAKEWLIDLRTADEFSADHVAGATNIEFQQIVPQVSKLGKSRSAYIAVPDVGLSLHGKRC